MISLSYFNYRRRLKDIKEFKFLYVEYLRTKDTAEKAKYRSAINNLIARVSESLTIIGRGTHRSYPAPAIGGSILEINIIANVFNPTLKLRGLTERMILDALEVAIGAYEELARKAFWQMVNPFYWIKEFILTILQIPFYVLGVSGFDAEKVQQSFLGKIVRLIWVLVMIASAVLAIVYYLKELELFAF